MNILEAFDSAELFGDDVRGETRQTWRSILAAAYGLELDENQRARFADVAGDREPPQRPVKELVVIAGRRADKTHMAAAKTLYDATVGPVVSGVLDNLAPGESAVAGFVAVDRAQAAVAIDYLRAMIQRSDTLSNMVVRETADTIELDNGVRLEVFTNDFRRVRGRTFLSIVFDEASFFRSDDAASPDIELYRACLPALVTTGGQLMIVTTPYARRGLAYRKWKEHYGQDDDDVLVVQGSTRQFNPTIDQRIIDEAFAADPQGARAEWLGEFRDDVSGFLAPEWIESASRDQATDLPPRGRVQYAAFCDPSGGRHDAFTLAVGHIDNDRRVVDAIRRTTPPLDPASVVAAYSDVLKRYGVTEVHGDRYSAEWVASAFRRHGIQYRVSDKDKSAIYLEAEPLFAQGGVEIPNDHRLVTELQSLERRTAQRGRDSVDHPRGGSDDTANAACGVLAVGLVARKKAVRLLY